MRNLSVTSIETKSEQVCIEISTDWQTALLPFISLPFSLEEIEFIHIKHSILRRVAVS